jgi:hypothetical protein
LRSQEILAARRSGKPLMSSVEKRRKEVGAYMKLSKDEQRKFREKRAPPEPIVRRTVHAASRTARC